MKQNTHLSITAAPVFLMAALILSCAGTPQTAESEIPVVQAAKAPPEIPHDNGLNSQAFKNIPPEARIYLERLSRAFSAQDEAFLLAQGEPHFEAEVRPRRARESYLALLYRTGTYATDTPRPGVTPPHLNPAAVSHIQYLSWEENGPLLEIKAQLMGKDGKITPCLIMLVWRLREPKIEGLFL
ncbi:hypothetical protein AGMMS50293_15030 [Spirochaetia bacterium]|nr:hypothetical protein AGMMS50293_15030 [Spirochaetia bacterium]